MAIKATNKIWLTHIFCLVILLISFRLTFAGEIYVPEPIVFVHGLSSEEGTWNSTKNALKKYFVEETGTPKYEYKINDEKAYFPHCDYQVINTGDIPTIARGTLVRSIYNGLENIPADCTSRKVNIVAHSMGGLVTRSLLKQRSDLQNSINKVIFIGTPHKGSPYASALWLLNKVKEEKLPALIKQNLCYFAKPGFSRSNFLPSDRLAYFALASNLAARYSSIASEFAIATNVFHAPDPTSPAIEELRLDQDVSYYSVVYGSAGGRLKSVEIAASYSGSEVFLADQKGNLAIPFKHKNIVGKNTSSNVTFWATKNILKFGNAFKFPPGESLDDVYINGGDGIVSLVSQGKLGNVYATLPNVNHLEETQQAQAILDALDDSPVIEDMYVVSADKDANGYSYSVYVVVKAKDYLLADVEITSMTLDGSPVNLTEFNDGKGHYKPYVKFKKNFLKERPDTNLIDKNGRTITLSPGEFYIRLNLQGDGQHQVDIKLKNPSNNPPTQKSLIIQRPAITNESPTGTIEERQPTIQANIYSPLGVDIDTDSDSLEMQLDGSPVSYTPSGWGSDITISYTPSSDLNPGTHTVTVNGRDIDGIPAEEMEWSFEIQQPRQPPIITDEKPTGEVSETRPTISARIYSPAGVSINLSSLVMKLDGNTVSRTTSGSSSNITVSYTPSSNLSRSSHTVSLYGRDVNGQSASKSWNFVVKEVLVDWIETWDGANSSMHKTYSGGNKEEDHRIVITGDHKWEGRVYTEVELWAESNSGFPPSGNNAGSYGAYNFDFLASSGGIDFSVNTAAYSKSTIPSCKVEDNGWVWCHFITYTTVYAGIHHTFDVPLQITKDSQLIFEGSNFVVLELIINNRGKQYKPGIYSLADFAGSILNRGITIATSNDESYPVRISAETSISAECAPTYPNPLVAESDVVKQSRSYHIGNIRITNLFPQ